MGTQFRLTKEESALMDECRKTSFWQRSVPLMAITTAFMTYRRVNSQVPPKFYGLKLAGGVLGAYILGKLSYIPECRKLILQRLPNSNLANSIESKPYDLISDMAQPPEIVSKTTANNMFGTRNEEEEQQQQQQQIDVLSPDLTDKNATRKYMTYDELRQKNRAEHTSKFPGTKVRNDAITPTSVQDSKPLSPLPILTNEQVATTAPKRSNARKNQYGDEVYE